MAGNPKEEEETRLNYYYYIAYGSNLSLEQMAVRCPDAIPVGTADILDHRLLFRGSKSGAYLTVEKTKGYHVPVVVWKVSANDLKRLDHYEGYPTFYYRKKMRLEVTDFAGKDIGEVTGLIYIMHENRPIGITTDRYYKVCYEGYKRFGFDTELLAEADRYSFANAEADAPEVWMA